MELKGTTDFSNLINLLFSSKKLKLKLLFLLTSFVGQGTKGSLVFTLAILDDLGSVSGVGTCLADFQI